jgi:hypothetical protein
MKYIPKWMPITKRWIIMKEIGGLSQLLEEKDCVKLSILSNYMWQDAVNAPPQVGAVIIICVVHPDGKGWDVGIARYDGMTFSDMGGKIIFGVGLWMEILPVEYRACT